MSDKSSFTRALFSGHTDDMLDIERFLSDHEALNGVLPRFLRYVQVWTTSDRAIEATPTSEGQWELARMLKGELESMGVCDLELTDHCYLVARLPASSGCAGAPTIGFMAHLDTSSEVSGQQVKPIIKERWNGNPIEQAEGRSISTESDSDLARYIGDTLIHTDGTTLLGADDKAGVAEIMAALGILIAHPELPHGPLEIIFTPDEETGKGLPEFPRDGITSVACYTLDGSAVGEVETECFNAYKADIEFHGKSIHVGLARGRLANAALMAATYATMLPRSESPESTDGYYGYFCPMEIQGDLESAHLEVFLRDFDQEGMERRLSALDAFARAVEAQFPGGSVVVTKELQYLNMKRKIDEHPRVLRLLWKAAEQAGVTPVLKPIRGGTDGARLTELGIPTPNIYAGGHAFHSRSEWASLSEMVAATRTVVELAGLWAREKP